MKQTHPVSMDADPGFLSFYQRQRPSLTAAFRQMTDDTRYIDDAVQEALLIARRKWPQISTYDKPGAWVAKVALRLLRRWQHHDRQHLDSGESVEPPSPPG
jgi:RNA polymerase sigma-70 factor (ECF subfamily)